MDNVVMYSIIISVLLFFFSVYYSYKRIRNNPAYEVLNPLLYFLLFSCSYYLLGGWTVSLTGQIFGLGFTDDTLVISRYISLYTCTIILFFFILSSPSKAVNNISFELSYLSTIFLKCVVYTSSIIGGVLILLYGKKLYITASTMHRVAAHEMFSEFTSGIPLGPILICSLLAASILFLKKGSNKKYFFYCLPIPLFPMFAHSRTYLSTFIIGFGISYIAKNPQQFKKYLIFGMFGGMALVLFTFTGFNDSLIYALYSATAEFSHTYLTIPFLIQNPDLIGSGDSISYYSNSLLKFVGLKFETKYFGHILHKEMDTPYSMAGNNISEALYYGGYFLVIFQPLLYSLLFLIIRKSRIKTNLFNFIALFIICLYMRTAVRGGMYLSLSSLAVYIGFLSFCIIFCAILNRQIKKEMVC